MDKQTIISDDRILAVRIILGALVAGVIVFATLVVFGLRALMEPVEGQFVSLLGVVFALTLLGLHFVVPRLLTRNALRPGSAPAEERLAGIWQTKMIVALALLEGPAFFNLIALLLEHNWWSLMVTGGLVLWMLCQFPTRTSVDHWIETQLMNAE